MRKVHTDCFGGKHDDFSFALLALLVGRRIERQKTANRSRTGRDELARASPYLYCTVGDVLLLVENRRPPYIAFGSSRTGGGSLERMAHAGIGHSSTAYRANYGCANWCLSRILGKLVGRIGSRVQQPGESGQGRSD